MGISGFDLPIWYHILMCRYRHIREVNLTYRGNKVDSSSFSSSSPAKTSVRLHVLSLAATAIDEQQQQQQQQQQHTAPHLTSNAAYPSSSTRIINHIIVINDLAYYLHIQHRHHHHHHRLHRVRRRSRLARAQVRGVSGGTVQTKLGG